MLILQYKYSRISKTRKQDEGKDYYSYRAVSRVFKDIENDTQSIFCRKRYSNVLTSVCIRARFGCLCLFCVIAHALLLWKYGSENVVSLTKAEDNKTN